MEKPGSQDTSAAAAVCSLGVDRTLICSKHLDYCIEWRILLVCLKITVAEPNRDPRRPPGALLQQGHPAHAAQDHVREAAVWLQEEGLTASLGNLGRCSVPHTVHQHVLTFRENLLWSGLCPLPLALSLGIAAKSLAPSSRHPPLG